MTGSSSSTVFVPKTSLVHKFICCMLSFVLLTSLTPSTAFAQENLEQSNTTVEAQVAPESSDVVEQSEAPDAAAPAPEVDAEAGAPAPEVETPAPETEAPVAPQPEANQPSQDVVAPNVQDKSEESAVAITKGERTPADEATVFSDAASQMAINDGFVVISSQKDYTENRVKGELTAGTELWANTCYEYDDGLDFYDDVIPSDASLSYQWMYAKTPATTPAEYQPIPGATNQNLLINDAFAKEYSGAYIAVAVTAGDTVYYGPTAWGGQDEFNVKNVPGPVLNLNANTLKLKSIAEELDNSFYKPSPKYGTDTNINKVLKAELKKRGYEGIGVEVSAAKFRDTNENATVGITTDWWGNGKITYFFADPDKVPYYSMTRLAQADVTFTLSIDEDTYDYTTMVTIPWDVKKTQEFLKGYADQLTIGFAEGDSLEAITQNVTLPYKAQGKSWSSVTWASSDEATLKVTGPTWEDRTGEVTRLYSDMPITLTATVGMGFSGAPSITVDKTFTGTIKGDPEMVEASKADLQKRVNATFVPENLGYVNSEDAVDVKNLTDDVIVPTPKDFGLDGKYYEVKYTSTTTSGEPLTINGYRANILAPLPGTDAAQGSLIVTITNKENAEVTATKSLKYSVVPLNQDEIDAELALMEATKAAYFEGIANGQSADAVTSNMHAFAKATMGEDGSVVWSYTKDNADAAGSGIVPVDLPGYDPMSSALWRLFKSSQPNVVHHENLLVVPDTYNTEVTVQSVLSSEKFARYAELYPDNADFQALANQPVSATFTVRGITGEDNPNPPAPEVPGKVQVTAKVIGVNDQGMPELWADPISVQMDKGATAADISKKLFDEAGLTYDAGDSEYGWFLNSIDSPFTGKTYGWDQDTGKFWQLFVNGKSSDFGASSVVLGQNDEILWFYSAFEETAPVPGDTVINPQADHPELDVFWPSFTGQSTNGAVTEAPTPTQQAELKWTHNLKQDGWNRSDALIVEGDIVIAAGSTLKRLDAETGEVKNKVKLYTGIDTTSRLLYTQGLILVPLHEGRIQCLSADTFETLWVSDKIAPINDYRQQSLSTMTADGNKLYFSTGAAGIEETYSGAVGCIDLLTGKLLWLHKSESYAYYWAGGVVVDGLYVIGDDSGSIVAYGENGEVVSSVNVGSRIRSSLIVDEATSTIYAADYSGVMHKLCIDAKGQLELVASTKFGSKSTSTPALANGKLIVGGMSVGTEANPWGDGQIAVIDAETMTLEHAVSELAEPDANGYDVVFGEIQASPLVSVQNGEIYVYFTANYEPGGMFMYRVGDEFITTIYEPEEAEYCISSVIAGPDGTLYYTNDSGNLFALKGSGKFLVSFNTNGGSAVTSVVVDPNTTVAQPENPTRDGYVFKGWFTDKKLTQRYDFATPVNNNTVLYAKWEKLQAPTPGGDDKPSVKPDTKPDTKPEGNNPQDNGNGNAGNGNAGNGHADTNGNTIQGQGSNGSVQNGSVAPSHKPVAQQDETKSEESAGKAKDEESADKATSDKKDSESDAEVTESAQDSDESTQSTTEQNTSDDDSQKGVATWVYVVGLIIGLAGLGGGVWWLASGRKRS